MVCTMPAFKASVFLVQEYVYCNYLEVFCEIEFLALFMGHSFR